MTRELAIEILRHYDDLVWQDKNKVTMGMVADAIRMGEEALSSPWRSVKEELPKDYKKPNIVLMRDKRGQYYRDICFYSDHWFGGYIDNDDGHYRVTHWMPIPEIPKEKEDAE